MQKFSTALLCFCFGITPSSSQRLYLTECLGGSRGAGAICYVYALHLCHVSGYTALLFIIPSFEFKVHEGKV